MAVKVTVKVAVKAAVKVAVKVAEKVAIKVAVTVALTVAVKVAFFYSVFVVGAVFQLRWRKKTYLMGRPLSWSQISNFQILLRHPRLAFDCLSVSFFDYRPIRMSDLLLALH